MPILGRGCVSANFQSDPLVSDHFPVNPADPSFCHIANYHFFYSSHAYVFPAFPLGSVLQPLLPESYDLDSTVVLLGHASCVMKKFSVKTEILCIYRNRIVSVFTEIFCFYRESLVLRRCNSAFTENLLRFF